MKLLWRYLAYNYQDGGARQLLSKIAQRIGRRLWSETAWFVYALRQTQQRTPTLPLEHRQLTLEQLQELKYPRALAFPDIFAERLQRGAKCHGFFIGGELAHVAWTTVGYLEIESGLTIVEPDCVGITDCFTLPEHRSKGVYVSVLRQLIADITATGRSFALIGVEVDNEPSIRGIEQVGFQPLYELRRRYRLGRQSTSRGAFDLHREIGAASLAGV